MDSSFDTSNVSMIFLLMDFHSSKETFEVESRLFSCLAIRAIFIGTGSYILKYSESHVKYNCCTLHKKYTFHEHL
jgi:hypothetical protein